MALGRRSGEPLTAARRQASPHRRSCVPCTHSRVKVIGARQRSQCQLPLRIEVHRDGCSVQPTVGAFEILPGERCAKAPRRLTTYGRRNGIACLRAAVRSSPRLLNGSSKFTTELLGHRERHMFRVFTRFQAQVTAVGITGSFQENMPQITIFTIRVIHRCGPAGIIAQAVTSSGISCSSP
jgi:hypothetical protein